MVLLLLIWTLFLCLNWRVTPGESRCDSRIKRQAILTLLSSVSLPVGQQTSQSLVVIPAMEGLQPVEATLDDDDVDTDEITLNDLNLTEGDTVRVTYSKAATPTSVSPN